MLQTLLSSPKTTGAISVYSQSSIKNMLKYQKRDIIRNIVEFGPGLWNITQYILDHMHSDAQLTCFEINEKDFKQHLDNLQDSRLTIHYISCEHISDYCQDNSVDLIISTIPLSLIDNEITQHIFNNSYTCLKSGWEFITGQYSTYAKKFIKPLFGNITTRRHLRNLPPVCILTSTKS